ncbi:hypothetical protein Xph01_22250 [Micromonospora phaseoli]|nr:hypothetical protein Xph01_22250 [Micromonospora phaseoli]
MVTQLFVITERMSVVLPGKGVGRHLMRRDMPDRTDAPFGPLNPGPGRPADRTVTGR